ncbi:hypothetical protein Q1695_005780 [Nippostrongylus brasiliensis]|nr:hypothetical protein Q1695_005780 [Nippostrongylus brasiliensis]
MKPFPYQLFTGMQQTDRIPSIICHYNSSSTAHDDDDFCIVDCSLRPDRRTDQRGYGSRLTPNSLRLSELAERVSVCVRFNQS